MGNPTDLQQKLNEYQAAVNKTYTNRERWKQETKTLIFDTLNKITGMAQLDWEVIRIEGIANLESIRLQLLAINSGIVIITKTEQKELVKHRGALIFSQAHNGDIIVMMEAPFVEDLMPKPEIAVLNSCDPEEVDEDYIYTQVENFIDIVFEWENNTEQKVPIGFRNHD